MRFQPHIAEGFEGREAMRQHAIQMRLDGHSRKEIATALGFKTGGKTLTEWLKGIPRPEWTKRNRAKDELREKAVSLRKEGFSYSEIKGRLKVSNGSLSLWLRDIPLTESQRVAIVEKRVKGSERRTAAVRAYHEAKRERVIRAAHNQIGCVSDRELFLAGVVAYWAEGSKAKPWRKSARVAFMNSDPSMIQLFLRWLDLIQVSKDRLTFRLSIHESADVTAATDYWSRIVGVPASLFKRPSLKRHNPKTVRRNEGETYFGCLVVVVRQSTELNRRIAGWFQGIDDALNPSACRESGKLIEIRRSVTAAHSTLAAGVNVQIVPPERDQGTRRV